MNQYNLGSVYGLYPQYRQFQYPAQNTPMPKTTPATDPVDTEKKNRKALLAFGAAACLAAGIGIYCLTRKRINLSDIEFDKGFAKLKGQTEGFTGEIKDKLKCGDKISLRYENGILQSSRRTGSVNFEKIYETVNGENIVKKTENGITKEFNLTRIKKARGAAHLHSVQRLENGKILATFRNGTREFEPIEMPEFLYHITSKKAMEGITSSGTLNISRNEQLAGIYLLDSENFLQRYSGTSVNGGRRDLFSAIFRQAGVKNKGLPLDSQELVIIKIPTKDLLSSGKLRIRTQEDFFKYQDEVSELSRKIGRKYNLRSLYDDAKRADFHSRLVSKGVMTQDEADDFIRRMTEKIHYGYSIDQAAALEKNHSVEYIFNHDIKLADFPSLTTRTIRTMDYAVPSSNNKRFDPAMAQHLFDAAQFS